MTTMNNEDPADPSVHVPRVLDAAGRGSGEPVAHMWQHPETGLTGFVEQAPPEELAHWERVNRPRKIIGPLYAGPQSHEPLTDEQINQLWCACLSIENHAFARDFARAIERAHNIRGAT